MLFRSPIPVTWDGSTYNPNIYGEQIITGELHVEQSRYTDKLEPTSTVKATARITLIDDRVFTPTLEQPTYSKQLYGGDLCFLVFSDKHLSGGTATANGKTVSGKFTLDKDQKIYGHSLTASTLLQAGQLHFDENENKTLIHLKFKDKEEILLNNPVELNNYLSSGTVKGMITFTLAQEVLQSGGYMVIDEVENHFNKEIVITLIRFFMDSRLNKNGGTLIFSTHYPELLDEYDRNDSIFITRNRNGITVENLSNILKRNDIKKSDAYQSGFLEGTTPTYEAYMRLKKSIALALM